MQVKNTGKTSQMPLFAFKYISSTLQTSSGFSHTIVKRQTWSMILFKSFTRVYHFTSNKITKYRHKKLRKTFDPNLGPKSFFSWFYLCHILYIVASYYCMQFQGKLMNHTWENSKKKSFGLNFASSGPNSGRQFFLCPSTADSPLWKIFVPPFRHVPSTSF